MQLSPHFTLKELCRSPRALEAGINNLATDPEVIENLTDFAINILEPIRIVTGPFSPGSCFRNRKLNKLVGSKSTSQHGKGEAADFDNLPGFTNYELACFVFMTLDFDQMILEKFNEDNPEDGWLHVSYNPRGNGRRQVLYYDGKNYFNYRMKLEFMKNG